MYLFNADLLKALGVISDTDGLNLEIERPDRSRRTITLRSRTVEKQTNWMEWGEMYGPVPDLTTAFAGRVSGDYRKGDAALPLHLRMRLPYWFEYLSDTKSVYFQFNFVEREWNHETFEEFRTRLFSFIDTHEVEKFIIDLRYNSGGDGSLLDPFLHEIIKRDRINRKGSLFVLVGRKTFSAAVMLIGSLKRHTNAYFVGEPAGAPLNHRGEPQTYTLPHSKFLLQLSTLYYQVGGPQDRSEYFQVDVPYQSSSRDYFSGADPALELILRNDLKSVCDALLAGGTRALGALREATEMQTAYDWYSPFSETDMNATGYLLLRADRTEDAIRAFLLNAAAYPRSWNVWDSLAEAYVKAGNNTRAIESYKKSLALNPGNLGAREMIAKLSGSR
jgi:tetratricopeptide (TPR) repeat protein